MVLPRGRWWVCSCLPALAGHHEQPGRCIHPPHSETSCCIYPPHPCCITSLQYPMLNPACSFKRPYLQQTEQHTEAQPLKRVQKQTAVHVTVKANSKQRAAGIVWLPCHSQQYTVHLTCSRCHGCSSTDRVHPTCSRCHRGSSTNGVHLTHSQCHRSSSTAESTCHGK